MSFGIETRSDLNFPGGLRDSFDHLVVNRFLNVQPGASAAALAVIEEDGAGRAWDRRLEIGVLEYYVRRFAAQLQRHFLEIAGGSMDDQLADFGGSCEGNLVDVGMRGQRGPCGFAVARNNVHYAFREAGFHDQLAKTQRGERRLLCGFQHDCAARGQSWTKFPRRHEEREIPRNDLAHDSHRFAQRVGEIFCAGSVGNRERNRVALDLSRPSRHIAEEIDCEGDISSLGDAERFAVVKALDVAELLGMLFEQIG